MFSNKTQRQAVSLLLFSFILISSFAVHGQSLPEEKDFFSNNGVACDVSQECPPYVGALVHRTDLFFDAEQTMPMLGHCTVTLIGEDQVLTSTHCIPPQIRQEGAKCNAWIQVSFPALKNTPYGLEDHVCEKIVKFVEIGANKTAEDGQEWAIIQLRHKSVRPTITPQPTELPFGTQIHGYTIYYNPFFPVGQMEKVTCNVMDLGYLFPQSFHATSSLFTASGCDKNILIGNSGTGFFDEQNNYVGLLSAMITQKYQPSSKVVEEGSPVILGTKALCFEYLGPRPTSCELDAADPEFQKAAIMSSTLNAFQRSLADNNFKSLKQRTSNYILWDPASPINLGSTFVDLYGDASFYDAVKYFNDHQLPHLATELKARAANILGETPRCVKNPTGASELFDQMMYTHFSFSDFTMYPYNEKGDMYFRMLKDKQLSVESVRLKLQLQISKINNLGNELGYLVKFDSSTVNTFKMSPDDVLQMESCRREGELKTQNCNGDKACEVSEATSTPSPVCQSLYRKSGFAHYLRSFAFRVPGC